MPVETQVNLTGSLGIEPVTIFRGHARVTSRRPPAFASWWRGEVGKAVRIGRFAVEADLDFAPEGERFSSLVVTTGAGTVKGTLDFRRFAQSGQLFMNVDLSADRADLVEARALAELFAGRSVTAGSIEQMTLALRADVLSADSVEAKSVVVEGELEGGEMNLRRLSVGDLSGASVEALGSISDLFGKPSGHIEASISATDFKGAANF